jgi:hypothetical protein
MIYAQNGDVKNRAAIKSIHNLHGFQFTLYDLPSRPNPYLLNHS